MTRKERVRKRNERWDEITRVYKEELEMSRKEIKEKEIFIAKHTGYGTKYVYRCFSFDDELQCLKYALEDYNNKK